MKTEVEIIDGGNAKLNPGWCWRLYSVTKGFGRTLIADGHGYRSPIKARRGFKDFIATLADLTPIVKRKDKDNAAT